MVRSMGECASAARAPPQRAPTRAHPPIHSSPSPGPDDYIIAALNVYLDIINIFLYLLRIFGSRE